MAQRAGLFEDSEDFDVSTFTPKKPTKQADPPSEAIRAAAEGTQFKSREPDSSPAKPVARQPRRRRTGRNLQLNLKVAAPTLESFYAISDQQGWVLGETLERAVAALQRELNTKAS